LARRYNQRVARLDNPLEGNVFLNELQGLRLLSRKVFRGQMRGERRSRNKGQSVEFVDYRPYLAGDDLRRIDWNMYGRLDRFYIKLFEEEEDLRLYVLLDSSASMRFGTPDKFDAARRLSAGLAYVVLSNFESVAVSVFGDGYSVVTTPSRGKGKIHPLLHKLGQLQPGGASQLKEAVRGFLAQARKPGIVCVISDFLLPEGSSAIAPLLGFGHEVHLIQTLAPAELNPALTGDLALVDSESGEALEISMGLQVMRRYHERLAALQHELRTFALRGGGKLFVYDSSQPLRDFFHQHLRRGRLLG
jgi:uncharacterized protein (DUF58 family)